MFNALKSQTDETKVVDAPEDCPVIQKVADVMVTEPATILCITGVPADDVVIGDTTTTSDATADVTVTDVTAVCSVDKAECSDDKLAVRDTSRQDIIEELESGEIYC